MLARLARERAPAESDGVARARDRPGARLGRAQGREDVVGGGTLHPVEPLRSQRPEPVGERRSKEPHDGIVHRVRDLGAKLRRFEHVREVGEPSLLEPVEQAVEPVLGDHELRHDALVHHQVLDGPVEEALQAGADAPPRLGVGEQGAEPFHRDRQVVGDRLLQRRDQSFGEPLEQRALVQEQPGAMRRDEPPDRLLQLRPRDAFLYPAIELDVLLCGGIEPRAGDELRQATGERVGEGLESRLELHDQGRGQLVAQRPPGRVQRVVQEPRDRAVERRARQADAPGLPL